MKKTAVLILSVSTLFFASASQADLPHAFIGASYGQAKIDSGITGITGTEKLDEQSNPSKIFAGYDFSNNISLEASYINFRAITQLGLNAGDRFTFNDTTYVVLANGTKFKISGTAYAAAMMYTAPLSSHFGLFGKAGVATYSFDLDMDSPTGRNSDTLNGTAFFAGIGGKFQFTKELSLRAEYEYFDSGKDDNVIRMISAGGSIAF